MQIGNQGSENTVERWIERGGGEKLKRPGKTEDKNLGKA
jgi:hypothetical protein